MKNNTPSPETIPIGEALLGRMLDANGQPIDGGKPLDAVPRQALVQPGAAQAQPAPPQMLESGIKVIDLYAPIVRGGVITMLARPGVGLIVATCEMLHHLATRRNGCAVIVKQEEAGSPFGELAAQLCECGVERFATIVAAQADDPPQTQQRAVLTGLTIAEHFRQDGREVLLVVAEPLVTEDSVARFRSLPHATTQADCTMLVWRVARAEEDENELPDYLRRESDGQIVFSVALARQRIWPAIDPLRSTSRLLDGHIVDSEHRRVAREAQELLRRYEPVANGEGEGTDTDRRLHARARRVRLFQTQPFVVAEPFTARPGVYVNVEETIRGFGALLSGQHDDLPEEALHFSGTLEQALGKKRP